MIKLLTQQSKFSLASLLIALGLGLLLSSACGTYTRLLDNNKPFINREGVINNNFVYLDGSYYYNPHKPYFIAIKADNSIMTGLLCREVYIGCIPTLIDYPISLVIDVVALPFDLAEDIKVKSYNNKHLIKENYGPFTLLYRTRYGGVPYLEIYYKDNKQPIKVLSYNLTIIEKQLMPQVALLVKTNTGSYYTIRDLGEEAEVIRVANDYNFVVKLPEHPSFRFLYRKNNDDAYQPCRFYSSDFSSKCLQVADSYSYSFIMALRDNLTTKIWDKQAIERTSVYKGKYNRNQKQVYLVSLSPDEQQAIYCNQANQFWLAKLNSEQVEYLSLTSQQLNALPKLAVGEDNTHIIVSDAVQRYKFYIKWFNEQFEWYQQEGEWLIKAKIEKESAAK